MYRIIGADQKEYGPASTEQIRQWIAEGRLNAQSIVRPEDGLDWTPIGRLPEFAEALGLQAPLPPAMGTVSVPVSIEQLAERDYDLDIGACVSRAWALMKNNFGTIFGGGAVYLGIQLVVSLLGQIPILGVVIAVANGIFVAAPLMAGLYYFLLKNIRRQSVEIGDIFAGFRSNYVQLILTYVVMMLLCFLVAMPGGFITGFGAFQMVNQHVATPARVLVVCVGVALMVLPLIYFTVSWLFALALVIDKQMSFWPALQLSRRMVNKHWWTVFGLLVIGSLINIAGLFACCVGLFISVPVAFASLMYAYEDIFSSSQSAAA
jgi:hypothetical protein